VRGHIRKRGANSWELKYDIVRAEGGRHTVYRSVKGTRREAAAELARLLHGSPMAVMSIRASSRSPTMSAPASSNGRPAGLSHREASRITPD